VSSGNGSQAGQPIGADAVEAGGPLSGRTALVTGGSRGIGRGIALHLAALGADVAITYARQVADARKTAEEIAALGRRCVPLQGSLGEPGVPARIAGEATEALGVIDLLVNNAGIASSGARVDATDPDELDELFAVNARGPAQLCGALLPAMRTRPRGDIVMISTILTQVITPNCVPYTMSKAAAEALALTIAVEEAFTNIHVNIVAPGLVSTEMGDRLIRARSQGQLERADALDSISPFGHVCRPEDVARVVGFLVSAENAYITGQRVVVDGGAALAAPHPRPAPLVASAGG